VLSAGRTPRSGDRRRLVTRPRPRHCRHPNSSSQLQVHRPGIADRHSANATALELEVRRRGVAIRPGDRHQETPVRSDLLHGSMPCRVSLPVRPGQLHDRWKRPWAKAASAVSAFASTSNTKARHHPRRRHGPAANQLIALFQPGQPHHGEEPCLEPVNPSAESQMPPGGAEPFPTTASSAPRQFGLRFWMASAMQDLLEDQELGSQVGRTMSESKPSSASAFPCPEPHHSLNGPGPSASLPFLHRPEPCDTQLPSPLLRLPPDQTQSPACSCLRTTQLIREVS